MITNKDLESFDYYEMFPETEKSSNPMKDYSEWVEDKILTEGHDRLIENTLGLVGEAGEVAEKIKKLIRDNNRYTSTDIIKELGDVVFYATALANYYGGDLSVTLAMNVKKLDDRELRGKLKGSGDNR
jgi:NTP pyrophosphatase (non-canonical NTP hydrolase)